MPAAAARPLAVALLVVLAGCQALPAGPQTSTVTPAPVPEDPFVLEATPVSEERVYLGDVATYDEGSTVHALLVEERAVDVRTGTFHDLRQLTDSYEYVRAGDRVYTDVSFRSDRIVYRLRFRLAPFANESRVVAHEDLSPAMRSAVTTALDEGSFNATADPRDGYYSVAHYERSTFGSSVSDHPAVAVDGEYYEPVAHVFLSGGLYDARNASVDAVDADEVVGYEDLSTTRRLFDEARRPDELAWTLGDPPLPVVRYEGRYYRFERVGHTDAFAPYVRVTASAEPASTTALRDALDAVRLEALDAPVRDAVRRAVDERRVDVESTETRDRLRVILDHYRYVRVDGRYYRLCSPSVGAGC